MAMYINNYYVLLLKKFIDKKNDTLIRSDRCFYFQFSKFIRQLGGFAFNDKFHFNNLIESIILST